MFKKEKSAKSQAEEAAAEKRAKAKKPESSSKQIFPDELIHALLEEAEKEK